VLEHITTAEAAAFVAAAASRLAATITPQHLVYSRNALFAGGVRPHLYCLPILKRERHRQALVAAATSGTRSSFSAPIPLLTRRTRRRMRAGAQGCYSAPVALALYAEAFEAAGALAGSKVSRAFFGADFYGCRETATK
jgi:dihydroorotase